jgi:hypothetical protein
MRQTMWGTSAALFVVAALAAEPVDAQMRFGLRGGANFATVTGDFADGEGPDSDGEGTRTGFHGGAFLEAPIAEIVGIQLGALYTQKGWEAEGIPSSADLDIVTKLDYFEVPALLVVSVPFSAASLRFSLGPTFAFLIKCDGTSFDVSGDCEDASGESEVTKFDLGGLVGAGLGFGMGGASLLLDGSLNMGFKSILKDAADLDLKNEVWSVSAGLMFPAGD